MFFVDYFFGASRTKLQILYQPGGQQKQDRPMAVTQSAKSWHCIYALLLSVTPMHNALGAEGIITELTPDCSYFVVKTNEAYALMEWNGDGKPERNDRLLGNFSTGSMNVIENVTRGGKVKVWIENYPISYDEAIKFYKSECQ